MVDIIRGAVSSPVSTDALIKFVENAGIEEGILYTGYPIISSPNEKSSLDALLISAKHGIVVFDIVDASDSVDRSEIRDTYYNLVLQRLIGHAELAKKRGQLVVEINVRTIAPASLNHNMIEETILNQHDFDTFLLEIEQHNFSYDDYKKIVQAIQAITKLKSRPARRALNVNSKGAILNSIEKSISNLDRMQSKAVIETADSVQRIRGLAGSGKTIVLALKVAYLHSKFPDWNIAVTYYTRSLKYQFIELITKFTIEHKSEEPDWTKVRVLHAWGSTRDSGLYYEFCRVNNVEYLDFNDAKYIFGTNSNLMDNISSKAISECKVSKEIFDVILIDEAQDFSESFLQLCYKLIKPASTINPKNKRLIYAYDELQKLNDSNFLRNPKDIFSGIDFDNLRDKPQQDIMLEKCYRNSAPVLVTAHALGFGIYRDNGQLVTMFKDKELWRDVGYKISDGNLEYGQEVVLRRDHDSSPDFLLEGIDLDELIQFKAFTSSEQQLNYVASQIVKNLTVDELDYRDIIVIHPDAINTKNELAPLRKILFDNKISSHLAGVSTSPDDFYVEDSIVCTSIYRAKGNEAAMIYVVDTEYCYEGPELIKKRNILFTAITRSKGWVRVTGVGQNMENLRAEFMKVKAENFQLKFRYPTPDEMAHLNLLHRDLSENDRMKIKESGKEIHSLLDKLKRKQIHPKDLPNEFDELRKILDEDI